MNVEPADRRHQSTLAVPADGTTDTESSAGAGVPRPMAVPGLATSRRKQGSAPEGGGLAIRRVLAGAEILKLSSERDHLIAFVGEDSYNEVVNRCTTAAQVRQVMTRLQTSNPVAWKYSSALALSRSSGISLGRIKAPKQPVTPGQVTEALDLVVPKGEVSGSNAPHMLTSGASAASAPLQIGPSTSAETKAPVLTLDSAPQQVVFGPYKPHGNFTSATGASVAKKDVATYVTTNWREAVYDDTRKQYQLPLGADNKTGADWAITFSMESGTAKVRHFGPFGTETSLAITKKYL